MRKGIAVTARPGVDNLGPVGIREGLLKRITALGAAGLDEIVIQPVLDPEREMTELAEPL